MSDWYREILDRLVELKLQELNEKENDQQKEKDKEK